MGRMGWKKKFLLEGSGVGGICFLNTGTVNSYVVCLYCGLIVNSKSQLSL